MKKLILFLSFLILSTGLHAFAGEVNTVTKDELKAKLGSQDVVILDVRTGRDWTSSEFKIKGAIRAPGSAIAKWSKNYQKGQELILYCA
jgi:rhodanese-related sulfurtransferase